MNNYRLIIQKGHIETEEGENSYFVVDREEIFNTTNKKEMSNSMLKSVFVSNLDEMIEEVL